MKFSYPKTIWKTTADNVPRLKQAIDLVWKSAPGWTLAGIALIIFQGSLPLAALYLIKLIVDSVSSGAGSETVLLWIGLAGGVALLVAIEKKIKDLSKFQLLIVDEIGYLPFTVDGAHAFCQLISRFSKVGLRFN